MNCKGLSQLIILLMSICFSVFTIAAEPQAISKDNTKTTAKQITNAHKPAKPVEPAKNILGKPIGNRNNYTVNSSKKEEVGIQCVFINTSNHSVDLNIWTSPSIDKPTETIHLDKGSKHKPFQVMKKFHFKLDNNWWCRIFAPNKEHEKYGFCAYFSVSDAAIVENNPFATWQKKEYSNGVSYHCRINNPKKHVGFYFYRPKK